MTPTLHFDTKKALEAVLAYEDINTYCGNLVHCGPNAEKTLKAEIAQATKDANNPQNAHLKGNYLSAIKLRQDLLVAMGPDRKSVV